MNDSFDTPSLHLDIEVKEKAQFQFAQFKIAQQLGLVDGSKGINGLEFHYDVIVNQ